MTLKVTKKDNSLGYQHILNYQLLTLTRINGFQWNILAPPPQPPKTKIKTKQTPLPLPSVLLFQV